MTKFFFDFFYTFNGNINKCFMKLGAVNQGDSYINGVDFVICGIPKFSTLPATTTKPPTSTKPMKTKQQKTNNNKKANSNYNN